MYCNQCGFKNSENDKFCGSCGNELEKREELSPREQNIENKRLLKEKIKNGPASLKFAHYSRIILPLLVVAQILFAIIAIVVSFSTSSGDEAGYGLLGLILLGPFILIFYGFYYLIIIGCDIIIPSIFVNSKKEPTSGVVAFRIIILILLYIVTLLPIIGFILNFTGAFMLPFYFFS